MADKNPFDQFDEAPKGAAKNVFDQFDEAQPSAIADVARQIPAASLKVSKGSWATPRGRQHRRQSVRSQRSVVGR
jgi:hypothetical protein